MPCGHRPWHRAASPQMERAGRAAETHRRSQERPPVNVARDKIRQHPGRGQPDRYTVRVPVLQLCRHAQAAVASSMARRTLFSAIFRWLPRRIAKRGAYYAECVGRPGRRVSSISPTNGSGSPAPMAGLDRGNAQFEVALSAGAKDLASLETCARVPPRPGRAGRHGRRTRRHQRYARHDRAKQQDRLGVYIGRGARATGEQAIAQALGK